MIPLQFGPKDTLRPRDIFTKIISLDQPLFWNKKNKKIKLQFSTKPNLRTKYHILIKPYVQTDFHGRTEEQLSTETNFELNPIFGQSHILILIYIFRLNHIIELNHIYGQNHVFGPIHTLKLKHIFGLKQIKSCNDAKYFIISCQNSAEL